MGTNNIVFLEVIEWFDETGMEMVHRIPESGSGDSLDSFINPHMTLAAGWGRLGNLANTNGNGAWAVQFKYEF